jgi:hypothetical protein
VGGIQLACGSIDRICKEVGRSRVNHVPGRRVATTSAAEPSNPSRVAGWTGHVFDLGGSSHRPGWRPFPPRPRRPRLSSWAPLPRLCTFRTLLSADYVTLTFMDRGGYEPRAAAWPTRQPRARVTNFDSHASNSLLYGIH